MNNSQAITKGSHAKRLLEDPVLIEAFEQVEAEIFREWKDSFSGNHDSREQLFHTLKGLERLKARLQATLDSGVLASRN
jgi:hypothetical protein